MADLHALVAGFTDVAAVYERGRPDYPPAVVARVVAELGATRTGPPARVLDLGAGTGKLTRPLLAAGLDVFAVEPLERMRAAFARRGRPRARVLDGRAEAIPLPDASLDGAVCAEAFHWFDGPRAADELHRVLRPGAGLVLVWLISQGDEGPWSQELWQMLRPLWERASHPSIIEGRRAEAIEAHPGFAPAARGRAVVRRRARPRGPAGLVRLVQRDRRAGRGGARRDARARRRDRRPPRRVRPPVPAPLARRPAA